MVTSIGDSGVYAGIAYMSLSAARAAWLNNAANIMLIVSLVGGVVATALIVWTGNVKEHYANAVADALRERIAQANERAAEANRVAEQERLARVRIEAGLASRRLGPDQAAKFVSSLVAFRGSLPAVNVTILGDLEAQQFGADLARAIQTAGVPVNLDQTGVMIPPPYGLLVTDTPSGALKAAFDAAGLSKVTFVPTTSAVPSIVVGLKPPAF